MSISSSGVRQLQIRRKATRLSSEAVRVASSTLRADRGTSTKRRLGSEPVSIWFAMSGQRSRSSGSSSSPPSIMKIARPTPGGTGCARTRAR